MSIRLLLIDDHAILRSGVRLMLQQETDWEICGEEVTGSAGVAAAAALKPDVVVLDFMLPDFDGLAALRKMKKERPRTEVIIFTAKTSEDLVHQAFDAGARSYLLKTEEPFHLVEAIRAAAIHKPYFTPWVSGIMHSRYHSGSARRAQLAIKGSLTAKEREIVKIIAEGKSNKDLATQMGVSLRTAEGYRAAIMDRLRLQSLGELIRYAIRNEIIEP